ncbi:MAG: bifunctional diaminohydroxyphosphoribosylaminopyrimidine deaminase/5-amino-6-(5-phosphoribosylamino)uracil reductase RibD [Desulfobulbus sp.]|jgi:diaminohydroxyphosphoribosylaminopyrimidine deaminase/5-amino-6-(5-phosphoribosylamino)uracil reductase
MKTMDRDTEFMGFALDEARKGLGRTSPNPAVGAVVIRDGQVVGRGYHQRAGTPHAEVHALHDAAEAAGGATMYVTLEPCNHVGRTPPCTHAILRAGIRRVVIGMGDPNPQVTGSGAAFLREHGVEVLGGVREEECIALNRPFIKHCTTGLPWVMLKAGLSLDGKITFFRGQGAALTGAASLQTVHGLRDQVDAILVGAGTALVDNPRLTTRLADAAGVGRDPVRVVMDTRLRMSPEARMLHQASNAPTWIFCGEDAPTERARALEAAGARVVRLPLDEEGHISMAAALRFLGGENLNSVLVEGGARIHGTLLRRQLADELVLLYAPFVVGDQGTPLVEGYARKDRETGPALTDITVSRLGDDVLYRALVRY